MIMLIGLLGCCLVLFNYFSVPAHDELAYGWLGLSTPHWGFCPRANTLSALVRQQYVGYFHDFSGRIFVHFVVGLFSGFGLHLLFDFCNAVVCMLLVLLVMRASGVPRTPSKYVQTFLIVFLFCWQASVFVRDAAFCINYLWTSCFLLFLLMRWRKELNYWFVPLFFLFGWGQEAFSMPLVVALLTAIVWRSIGEKHFAATRCQCACWLALLSGTAFLCCAPSAVARASRYAERDSFALIIGKNLATIVLELWPVVLLTLLAIVLFAHHRDFLRFVTRDIEWWLFGGASFCMYAILAKNTYHIIAPCLICSIVLAIRHRDCYGLKMRRWLAPMFVFSALWFSVALGAQIVIGMDAYAMLARYKNDPQGITKRTNFVLGPFLHTVQHWCWDRWARSLFRWEFGLERDPAIFNDELYDKLYLGNGDWFEAAKPVPCTGCWTTENSFVVLVKEGCDDLTDEQRAAVDAYLATAGVDRRFSRMPGRFRLMFPTSAWPIALPSDIFTFRSKSGVVYTVYNRGKE